MSLKNCEKWQNPDSRFGAKYAIMRRAYFCLCPVPALLIVMMRHVEFGAAIFVMLAFMFASALLTLVGIILLQVPTDGRRKFTLVLAILAAAMPGILFVATIAIFSER